VRPGLTSLADQVKNTLFWAKGKQIFLKINEIYFSFNLLASFVGAALATSILSFNTLPILAQTGSSSGFETDGILTAWQALAIVTTLTILLSWVLVVNQMLSGTLREINKVLKMHLYIHSNLQGWPR
jgi:hypothetical protein